MTTQKHTSPQAGDEVSREFEAAKASLRRAIAMAVIGIAGVGLAMALYQSSIRGPNGLRWPIVAALSACALLGLMGIVQGWRATHRVKHAREAVRQHALNALGFTSDPPPDKHNRDELFRRVSHLSVLTHASRGLMSSARGAVAGATVDFLEHRYMVHTGKSSHAVYHTVAACDCPASWPDLTLTHQSFLHKIGEALGYHDIRVEGEEFNRTWRVKSKDEAFAVTLLSPQIQAWLGAMHKDESWYIGHGRVCRVRRKLLEASEYAGFVEGLVELLSMIPPEMQAWESAAGE